MFQQRIKPLYCLLLILFISTFNNALSQVVSQNKAKGPEYSSLKPPLQLAKSYSEHINIKHYWISEKLDGVRGYWTGKYLLTRGGNIIKTPAWFTHNWPSYAMDGELWIARNQFEQVSGCVRRKTATNNCWHKVKFMIFDLPTQSGDFSARISLMRELIKEQRSPYIFMIEQKRITTHEKLQSHLDEVIKNNGEGLMLHKANAHYQVGRNNNVLKLKRHQDADAIVIKHLPGKGNNKGFMGSIVVRTNDGIEFKIGTGFSQQQRQTPPPIGSTITYKYIGKTQRGVPRFASFMRIKSQQ